MLFSRWNATFSFRNLGLQLEGGKLRRDLTLNLTLASGYLNREARGALVADMLSGLDGFLKFMSILSICIMTSAIHHNVSRT